MSTADSGHPAVRPEDRVEEVGPSPAPAATRRSEHPVLEAELEQFGHEARRIAAGGRMRAAIGFALGALAGIAVATVLPRDESATRFFGRADAARQR